MKKIINDPKNVVDEMVDGLVRAYPQYLTKLPDTEAMVRSDQDSMQGKVGIVSGGGSGHEPPTPALLALACSALPWQDRFSPHRRQTKFMRQLRLSIKVRAFS